MEQEIFDDYIWNEHKKILTADKHKIPGLRNLSHFTPMAPGVPVPLHYHSDIRSEEHTSELQSQR